MTLLKNNASPLNVKELAHKKNVSFKAKFALTKSEHQNITPSHPTDGGDGLQSCAKRRRYMRRGSKCPSMFRLSKVVVSKPLDELDSKSFAEKWRDEHGYDPRRKLKEQA